MTSPRSNPLILKGYPVEALDPARAIEICRSILLAHPRRLAFAGKIGAGKTSVCEAIALGDIPILNHADTLKEEVLEYMASAVIKGVFKEENSSAAFHHFCTYMGFEPEVVEKDLWELLGPVWHDMQTMTMTAIERNLEPELRFFDTLQRGEYLGHKVGYVDKHKDFMRPSLVSYGYAIKQLGANQSYWVEQTVARSIGQPICLNGDTRYAEDEMDVLEYCGWSSVYLWIDRATQDVRRPGLKPEQTNNHSETSIDWTDCDFVIDARKPLADVLMTLGTWLGDRKGTRSFTPPDNGGFEVASNE